MMVLFRQTQRPSIYHAATIRDIPPEVHGESLSYLVPGKRDLVSASLVCRAWYPVARRLIVSKKSFGNGIEKFGCGLQIRMMVGADILWIGYLHLDLETIGKESAMMIVPFVSHSLSSLSLCFPQSLDCVDLFEAFFDQSPWIRSLKLESFYFGDDPASMSQSLKDGFGRLRQLDMELCRGNLEAFIEQIPTPDLRVFTFMSHSDPDVNTDILSAVAMNYRSLTTIVIFVVLDSFDCLLKIVEDCRDVETLYLYTARGPLMELADVKAIASLPRLKSLRIEGGAFEDDALSGLARCGGLRRLSLRNTSGLGDVLPIIGGRLFSLNICCNASIVPGIVEHCPGLEYLVLRFDDYHVDTAPLEEACKSGLKRLAKLKMYGGSVRLGTDWEGY